jgi:hypothetical protein
MMNNNLERKEEIFLKYLESNFNERMKKKSYNGRMFKN